VLVNVLANRLGNVIKKVVSPFQSASVKGRQILDDILITRKCKKELLLFKVDFEKAFDSVCWDYLDKAMGKMMFPNLWRKWINWSALVRYDYHFCFGEW